MMRNTVVGLLFAATMLVSAMAHAETRVALVIGNSAYQHTTELTNPKNDAGDMAAALKSVGFDVVEALDADKAKLDSALRSFTEKLSGADIALFFYAGHGLQVGAQNYLVPVDAKLGKERDLAFEAMRVDFVMRQMEIDREGKTSIVILDACRDNPLSRNLARSMGTRSTAIGRGLAATATGLGTFISYATQPGNVALDGKGRNSPFTTALLKHMPVKGRSLYSTMIEVRKEVVAATDGEQVPWDHSALTGDFYFVPGEVAPQEGKVSQAPAASADDVAALKDRLRKLEEEAKAMPQGAPAGAMMTADGIRLAELRARAANLDDLVNDLRKKLTDKSMEQARAGPSDKMKLQRDVSNIMLEWTRRGQDLKKLRDEIAILEGKAVPAKDAASDTANESRTSAANENDTSGESKTAAVAPPPVTLAPDPNASAASFSQDDNVRLEGSEIRSFRAPNPDACRNTCVEEQGCIGYQHGRKIPVMGTCTLYSAVTARHEDKHWRSGMRSTSEAGASKGASKAAVLLPPELLGTKPTRIDRGFKVFEGASLEGDVIKMAAADSTLSCMTVCKNTAGCTAAVFLAKIGELGNMCTTYGRITKANTGRNGASALIREN